jgi:hypothetical protein
VSPWWAEPVTLELAPDALRLAGRRVPLAGPLPAALAALSAAQGAELLPRGRRCRVVVDDGLLRYALVRWPEGLGRGAEREAFVAHRLKEVHGIAAPEWCWRVDPEPAPRPALVCAAPTALVAALRDLARRQGCKLVELSGAFVRHYNQGRRGFATPVGALLVEGAGRFTLGLWRDGAWRALRSQPASADRATALGLLLGSAGLTGQGGVLYVAGPACPAPAGWRVEVLGGAA